MTLIMGLERGYRWGKGLWSEEGGGGESDPESEMLDTLTLDEREDGAILRLPGSALWNKVSIYDASHTSHV